METKRQITQYIAMITFLLTLSAATWSNKFSDNGFIWSNINIIGVIFFSIITVLLLYKQRPNHKLRLHNIIYMISIGTLLIAIQFIVTMFVAPLGIFGYIFFVIGPQTVQFLIAMFAALFALPIILYVISEKLKHKTTH